LAEALKYTEKLPFEIKLSQSSKKLIEHIDKFGAFRYLESSFYLYGPKLVELDKAVWEIRRYCTPLNYERKFRDGEGATQGTLCLFAGKNP
jgi:hypothetical protein